jgi:hypothetical protein
MFSVPAATVVTTSMVPAVRKKTSLETLKWVRALVSDIKSDHQNQQKQTETKPILNTTNWEVLGSVLVALFGDAEPELVKRFVSLTKRAYRRKSIAQSFEGILPLHPTKNQNGFSTDQYFSAASISNALEQNESKESNETNNPTIRPPWAQLNSWRWICSSIQEKSVAHFSFFGSVPEKRPNFFTLTILLHAKNMKYQPSFKKK